MPIRVEWTDFPITGSSQKLKKLEGSMLLQVNVITGHVPLFFPQARDIQEFIPLINQIIARFKVSWICWSTFSFCLSCYEKVHSCCSCLWDMTWLPSAAQSGERWSAEQEAASLRASSPIWVSEAVYFSRYPPNGELACRLGGCRVKPQSDPDSGSLDTCNWKESAVKVLWWHLQNNG